jgi:hypothetical protein
MNKAHELTSLFGSILSAGNSSIVSNFELWISDLFRISDFGFLILENLFVVCNRGTKTS